jgi:alanine-synthesizing transaminase
VFSNRARWDAPLNQLTIARRSHAGELIDLTETNPTRVGIEYPLDELSDSLALASRAPYTPDPRGLHSARAALAGHLGCRAEDLLLTSSTSEAYGYLFKLLTDPGDEIATAIPSYPLLEHLAAMELVSIRHFPLALHRRWEIERGAIARALGQRTRALVVVNPNNPTGSFVSADEQEALASHGIPLISDEVFLDYPLEGSGRTVVRDDVLTFTLGGLSKSAGLPHFKLGWIRVSGPGSKEALEGLEAIADNFLSVATPVQVALPDLLRLGAAIRGRIRERTSANLSTLRRVFSDLKAVEVLPVEGGWSAVLRVPRLQTDEDLAIDLLKRGVAVQPGYFFDFDREGFLIVSLLPPTDEFEKGALLIAEQQKERA